METFVRSMKLRVRDCVILLIAVCVVLAPQKAQSWGAEGCWVVALIAMDSLDPGRAQSDRATARHEWAAACADVGISFRAFGIFADNDPSVQPPSGSTGVSAGHQE